jgi:hypothetical protein
VSKFPVPPGSTIDEAIELYKAGIFASYTLLSHDLFISPKSFSQEEKIEVIINAAGTNDLPILLYSFIFLII